MKTDSGMAQFRGCLVPVPMRYVDFWFDESCDPTNQNRSDPPINGPPAPKANEYPIVNQSTVMMHVMVNVCITVESTFLT
jgi:hypothetical protein